MERRWRWLTQGVVNSSQVNGVAKSMDPADTAAALQLKGTFRSLGFHPESGGVGTGQRGHTTWGCPCYLTSKLGVLILGSSWAKGLNFQGLSFPCALSVEDSLPLSSGQGEGARQELQEGLAFCIFSKTGIIQSRVGIGPK